MQMKLLLIVFSFCLVFATACENTVEKSLDDLFPIYFPLKVGNYWIYETFQINQFSQKIPDTESIDSLVVIFQNVLDDRDAYHIAIYRDELLIDTLILSRNGPFLHAFVGEDFLNVERLNKRWFRIADFQKPDWWNIFDTIYFDANLVYNGLNRTATSRYTTNVYFEGNYPILINNDSNSALMYRIKTDNKVDYTHLFNYSVWLDSLIYNDSGTEVIDTVKVERFRPDSLKISKYHVRENKFWYSEQIGFSQIKYEPSLHFTLSRKDTLVQTNEGLKRVTLEKEIDRVLYNGRFCKLIRYRIQ